MKILSLIAKEIRHRWINFLLAVLAVTIAVAMFVSFCTAERASERETARIMLTMGYNLHILPENTDIDRFLLTGLSDGTMPEQYLEKLASRKGFSYNHLLASLQRKMKLRGVEIVLTGLAPELCPPGHKKPPMIYQIEHGTAYVGYRAAEKLGIEEGDLLELEDKKLKVVNCLKEQGGIADIRIQCHLHDAQQILHLPDRISQIQAVDCLCFAPTDDPVSILRSQIKSVLPDAQVLQSRSMATARTRQRRMIRDIFAVVMPGIAIACGIWIAVLTMMNVRDREHEIGILRAVGYGAGRVLLLFLGRAVVVGLLGAMLGFLFGTALAQYFGPGVFKITAPTILSPQLAWLLWSLLLAPVFSAIASFIPTVLAATMDPAAILTEE